MRTHFQSLTDVIVALATPPGVSALAVIRVSGTDAIAIVQQIWKGKALTEMAGNQFVFGRLVDENGIIDEVVAAIYRAPKSFTGDEMVELTTHGNMYVVERAMQALIKVGGRAAEAGEFTKRAFLNGKMDLSQAEAVADIIHADSAAAHQTAMNQLRGGISKELKVLRQELLDFAGLLELELDFSEEDVEFANRDRLTHLMRQILAVILQLAGTFKAGNAIKNGIAVVIAGKPNAGKSTLLNALLQEERAIVSEIAGTTRDVIEDELLIEGIRFRFIDTAGLRATTDTIEAIGVARSKEQMGKADVILYLFDASITTPEELAEEVGEWEELGKPIVLIANKYDLGTAGNYPEGTQFISAKNKEGIEPLKQLLLQKTIDQSVAADGVMITNIRHHEALQASGIALQKALQHIETQIGTELIAEEIREALYQLGLITGEVNNEELLGTIFSRFCIGK